MLKFHSECVNECSIHITSVSVCKRTFIVELSRVEKNNQKVKLKRHLQSIIHTHPYRFLRD